MNYKGLSINKKKVQGLRIKEISGLTEKTGQNSLFFPKLPAAFTT